MSKMLRRLVLALLVLLVVVLVGTGLYHHWEEILWWLFDFFRARL